MEIAIKILSIIGTVLTALQFHKVVISVIGFFKTKEFPATEKRFTYGICVAARNEELVIKNLLDSIKNQDYPLDKIKVFVVAHNCTDKTAQIVNQYAEDNKDLKVYCYEHNDANQRTKGFALKHLFNIINERAGSDEECDGYFIFDADNALNQDYISRMNEAFASGKKIVTSFRNSKNFFQNWISFQYAVHWISTCLGENRGKSVTKLSCRIQGTGFLFAKELVKDGWKYTSLTEDRAFCSDAVVKGYEISYCEKAIFFDEQPYTLKVALRQRLRWSKGHLQSSLENEPKLLKNMSKFDKNFFRSYDCFWLNFPGTIESIIRRMIMWILMIIVGIFVTHNSGSVILGILSGILTGWLKNFLSGALTCIVSTIYYRKRIKDFKFWKFVSGTLLYGTFTLIGKFTMYIALFKHVDWKPIPHETVMDMKKLN